MRKTVWGPLYWNFLHNLVIRIKNEDYIKEKIKIWEIINGICNHLPCPLCSSHAKAYIRKFRIQHSVNKDDLIKFIHKMHNDVNKRTRKKEFDYDEHLKKYNQMNFVNVLNEFFNMNLNQQPSPAMIMQKFARKRFIMTLVDYFKKNLNKYDTVLIKEV